MRRNIPLPRSWNRRVKATVLQILALSHYTFTGMVARASRNRHHRTRLQAEIDRLDQEFVLLQEEMRIKDARMERLVPHRRPFYTPLERMAILELRAARGWSAQQTADRFLLAPATVAAWMARIDEEGPNALLRMKETVNKFPDLVRYIVRRLKVLCPQLGKVKIAEMLCRAGLHLAPTTVARMLREEPDGSEPIAVAAVGPVVRAECTRRLVVPLRRERTRREIATYVEWYNGHRPHGALGVRTPDEVYNGLLPACEKPRLELRSRWPAQARCASPQAPMDRGGPQDARLEIAFLGGRRHLPIVSLRRAA